MDFDKERAAWDLYGSSDWTRDNIDATNGFAFTVRAAARSPSPLARAYACA